MFATQDDCNQFYMSKVRGLLKHVKQIRKTLKSRSALQDGEPIHPEVKKKMAADTLKYRLQARYWYDRIHQ